MAEKFAIAFFDWLLMSYHRGQVLLASLERLTHEDTVVVGIGLATLLAGFSRADEGMFPISEIGQLNLQSRGLEIRSSRSLILTALVCWMASVESMVAQVLSCRPAA